MELKLLKLFLDPFTDTVYSQLKGRSIYAARFYSLLPVAGNNKQTKRTRKQLHCYYEQLNNLFKPEFSRQMATSSMRNLRERNNLTKKIKVVSSSSMRI